LSAGSCVATALGLFVGEFVGDPLWVGVGMPGDEVATVGVGLMVTEVDALGVDDGDSDFDGVGDAFPWLVPTCAGGGKSSTGSPARAPSIICCHVAAGRSPP
jgi:hypothetical protein